MKVRQSWVVLTGVALAVASACGTDDSDPAPGKTGDAGAAGEESSAQAGTTSAATGGAGGTPDAVAGAGGTSGGAAGAGAGAGDTGAVGGAGGEGGVPVVVSKDINGHIYGLSDELVILIDGVNVPIDVDGQFSVANGPDEYQLQVCAPNYKFVRIFDGLRTRAPLVDMGTGFADPPYEATIRGKVTGGLSTPFAIADDETVFTQLAYSSQTNGYLYPLSSIDPPEGYDLNPLWSGSETDTGEVLAIQYVFKSQVGVKEYTGFGRRPITIADGSIHGSVNGSADTNVAFNLPTVSTITGNLSLPSGWTRKGSYVHMGPFMTDLLFEGDFSLVVPQLESIPMWVLIQADGPEGSADFKAPVPNASPWNIEVPSPPKQLSPVANANAVTHSTAFSWNGLPAAAAASVFWEVGDWRIQRFTTAASTTIPDLSAYGVAFLAATESAWSVEAVGPVTTMDDVLTRIHDHARDVAEPSFFINSVNRVFTTAP